MLSAGEFRKGVTVEIDGKVCVIVDFQHVKPGKGAAFVRTKYKNIITGAVLETAFKPEDKFKKAHIDRKKMQYLYNDGDFYYYMDQETYEQISIGADVAEEGMKFVKDNEIVTVSSYRGNPFLVAPPTPVELKVTETGPGVKGNPATGAPKPATVETGALVMVPLFIEQDEMIKIDTRTGEYLSRA